MTEKEKEMIEFYRNRGISYIQIANKLKISVNTIKTHCKRHGLGGVRAYGVGGDAKGCEYCGKPIQQTLGKRPRRFCCDKCRNLWWNSHLYLVNRKAYYEYECKHCGKHFRAYRDNDRQYCSRACYIAERFGGRKRE